MKWRSVITEKSDIDSSGYIGIKADIYCDDEKIYPDYSIYVLADTVIVTIQTKLTELKLQYEKSTSYDVGAEITI